MSQSRTARTILDNAACEAMLQGTFQGVMAFCDPSEAYVTPLNHAYREGCFCFHCGTGGQKIECMKRNASVVYVVQRYYGTREGFAGSQRCHGQWESVLAFGQARYLETEAELRPAFDIFMRWHGDPDRVTTPADLKRTCGILLSVDRMTARREGKDGKTEFFEWRPPCFPGRGSQR